MGQVNYTEEVTKEIVDSYVQAGDKTEIVKILAEKFEKSQKSIIAKLSKERVYLKKEYRSKIGEKPVSKKELIVQLCNFLEANPEKLQGLVKVPKPELLYLLEMCGVETKQSTK